MYKKISIKKTLLFNLFLLVLTTVFAITVFASEKENDVIQEDENSILTASDGQEQVRLVNLEKQREETRIEQERIAEEKRLAEEQKLKEEAEKQRLAKLAAEKEEQKTATVVPATSNKAGTTNGSNLGTFEATAYGPDCYGCSGITANGTDIRNGNIYSNGYRVIAADPRVIPMNSIVKITYSSGSTEMAIVADTGGAVKGNIIDIAFASEAETPAFGRQQVQIELIK